MRNENWLLEMDIMTNRLKCKDERPIRHLFLAEALWVRYIFPFRKVGKCQCVQNQWVLQSALDTN